jgi:hypothetical protein
MIGVKMAEKNVADMVNHGICFKEPSHCSGAHIEKQFAVTGFD